MKYENVALAKKIISEILYINIATVTPDGKPWNNPVYAAFDENYNFYWGSDKNSQHSKNIKRNNSVFLVIYDSTVPVGEGVGVYIKATTVELEDPKEIKFAHQLLQARRPVPYWKLKQVQGDAPIRLYKAVPEKFWVNGDKERNGNYIDIRREVKLP